MKMLVTGALVCTGLLAGCGTESGSIKPLDPASTTAVSTTTTAIKPLPTTRATAATTTTTTTTKPTTTTAAAPTSLFADFPDVGEPLTEAQVIEVANAGAAHPFRVAYEVTGPSGALAIGNPVTVNAPPRAVVRYGGSARFKLSNAQTVTCFMPDGIWDCNYDEPASNAGFFADGQSSYAGKVREATRAADQTIAGRRALCASIVTIESGGTAGRYFLCADHQAGAALRFDSQNAEATMSSKAVSFGQPTEADFVLPAPAK